MIKVKNPEKGEISLDYLGGPNLITQVLESRGDRRVGHRDEVCEKSTHHCQL